MIYDIWFFGRLVISIVFMVGLYYFIDWFIPMIGLMKHEREYSNAFKKVNKGKISREEFIEHGISMIGLVRNCDLIEYARIS